MHRNKTWSYQNGDKNYLAVSDDVSTQIQCICTQFIKAKLKREGSMTRKISVLLDIPPHGQLRNVQHTLLILNRMSHELERLHPRTFTNITLPIAEAAPLLVETIGKTLFKHDVTWGKIISYLTISSTFAADCVRAGQLDIIQSIVDSLSSVMIDEAGPWIEKEGGWNALSDHIRPLGSEHITFLGFLTTLVGFLLAVHWTWAIFKSLSKQVSNIL